MRPTASAGIWRVAAATLVFAVPSVAHAQFSLFEKILERFEYFNVGYSVSGLAPRPPAFSAGARGKQPSAIGLQGLNIEFAFGLSAVSAVAATKSETTYVLTQQQFTRVGDRIDTVKTFAVRIEKKERRDTSVYIDLAIGYSHQWGLSSTDSSAEFTGSVRELPNVSIYASFRDVEIASFSPYIGLRTGLVTLHQATFYTSQAASTSRLQYPVGAQTFQFGAVGGLVGSLPFAEVFVELSYLHRLFSGLQYTAKDSQLPQRLPTTMNASVVGLGVGIQFDMPKKAP